MSAHAHPGRWRGRFVKLLWLAGMLAVLHLISYLTGFGDWLKGTPLAAGAVRLLAVLFLGAGAVAMLTVAEEGEEPRRLRNWFYAAIAAVLAGLNAALLIGGEDTLNFSGSN